MSTIIKDGAFGDKYSLKIVGRDQYRIITDGREDSKGFKGGLNQCLSEIGLRRIEDEVEGKELTVFELISIQKNIQEALQKCFSNNSVIPMSEHEAMEMMDTKTAHMEEVK